MTAENHKHKYVKVVEWINSPTEPSDVRIPHIFSVVKACDCGETMPTMAAREDVESFVDNNTCKVCGAWMVSATHLSERDCIKDLCSRVRCVEELLKSVCDALMNIRYK